MIFQRTERLLGSKTLQDIRQTRIIVFGVGGVGSWCAEALARTGIGHLTIVDSDCVSVSNINRQLMATSQTVGQPKVEALKERLLAINPEADICAIRDTYCAQTAHKFHLEDYDFVVDAIDSLKDKALLILNATAASVKLYSSMGAALKCDPRQISVAEFWQVKGCPLARALRNRFKRDKQFPRHKFQCVYSPELLENLGSTDEQCTYQAQINGSLVHITAIFGFTLAGMIIEKIRLGD